MSDEPVEAAAQKDTRLIVRFTTEEAQVCINMINIAVMAKGLDAAEAGLVLSRRIREATTP